MQSVKAEGKAGTLECPSCKYVGFGWKYVMFVDQVSPIEDGGLVRLDRAEDRMDPDDDRLECPSCRHRVAVPEGLKFKLP